MSILTQIKNSMTSKACHAILFMVIKKKTIRVLMNSLSH